MDFPAIRPAAGAPDQPFGFEAAAEFDGGVMADLQPLGQGADCGRRPTRQPLDRQQCLVLLRLDAGGARGLFAEIQEAPDLIAKLRERPVIDLSYGSSGHPTIISYDDIKAREKSWAPFQAIEQTGRAEELRVLQRTPV